MYLLSCNERYRIVSEKSKRSNEIVMRKTFLMLNSAEHEI